MVVVSGLHVVKGTSGVVGVIVGGGVKLLGSSIWLQQPVEWKGGKEGEKQP